MKMENKIKDIIDMLEDALAFEDWRKVENAQKELTFLLSIKTSPDVGVNKPQIILRIVLFPDPLSPFIIVIELCLIRKLMLSKISRLLLL